MASNTEINQAQFEDLKARIKLIAEADPDQYQNDFALKRYLRAFGTVDKAFQAILKTNKWRREYEVSQLNVDHPIIKKHLDENKIKVLRHRDMQGRPVLYIPAKDHNARERDIDELTKFFVYCLEEACKKCYEEVIDNLCIVFDLKDFGLSSMDYELVKNLIWLLSRHYPERLGVCLIINAPTLFSGCWAVIKGWLDEKTASKVTFVSSESELCTYLIPEILPDYTRI